MHQTYRQLGNLCQNTMYSTWNVPLDFTVLNIQGDDFYGICL